MVSPIDGSSRISSNVIASGDPSLLTWAIKRAKLEEGQALEARVSVTREAKKTETPEALPQKGFDTASMISVLKKVNNKTWPSWEDLQKFQNYSGLNTQERSILKWLQRDQNLFKRLASLDGKSERLSDEGIKRAAAGGDWLVLEAQDLERLQASAKPSANSLERDSTDALGNTKATLQAGPVRNPSAMPTPEALWQLLQRIAPTVQLNLQQAVTPAFWQQLGGLNLNSPNLTSLSASERGWLSQLQQSQSLHLLAQIMQRLKAQQLTPEALRILISLWQLPPSAAGLPLAVWTGKSNAEKPFSASRQKLKEEDHGPEGVVEAVEAVFGLAPVKPVNALDAPPEDFTTSRLSASVMSKMIARYLPAGSDDITMDLLMRIEPENDAEKEQLELLRQEPVFKALAAMDHHPEGLSLQDVRLALGKHALVLQDEHLRLLITF